jgi:hypothetical protein
MTDRAAASLVLLALILAATPAHAAPTVGYHARVQTVSWIPIPVADIEQTISAKVLEVLSADGLLRLERAKIDSRTREPKTAGMDLMLEIFGEIVEDAGNFSVILSLSPVGRSGLPSFVASDTCSISRLKVAAKGRKAVIFSRMVQAARQAAERLQRAVRSRQGLLQQGTLPGAGQRDTDLSQMMTWGRIEPPRVRPTGVELATFASSAAPVAARIAAGWRVARQAFDNANVRHVLEHAALFDVNARLRQEALRMLEPASRSHAFTQRVILAVARQDVDPGVRSQALELSKGFFGLSATQTLQTWVYLLGSKVAELNQRGFASLAQHLAARPDTPNLDLGVLSCLRRVQVLEQGRRRKERCLRLLDKIPPPRSTNVLLGYLSLPLDSARTDLPDERGEGPFSSAVKMALEGGCRLDALWHVLYSQLRHSSDPQTTAVLLGAMLRIHATPELVGRHAELLRAPDEQELRDPKQSKLRRAVAEDFAVALRKKQPPWNVLGWAAIRQAVEQHLPRLREGATSRDQYWLRAELRRFERLLKQLGQQEQLKHRVALARHLRPGAPPDVEPEAIDHLTRCALQGGEEARQDCAEALGWLVLTYRGRVRRQAVAASYGLLRQTRHPLSQKAAESLQTTLGTLTRRYRNPSESPCEPPRRR